MTNINILNMPLSTQAALEGGVRPEVQQYLDSIKGDAEQLKQSAIDVTTDVMHRLYCGMYLIGRSFKDVSNLPETCALMKRAIQTELISALSTQYPDFAQFDIDISHNDNGVVTMVGNNDFTNTILNAMNQLMNSPTADSPNAALHELVEMDEYNEYDEYDEDDDGLY